MSDTATGLKYPYFSEAEMNVLYPDLPYVQPGEILAEGVVVRDFAELGPNPKLFSITKDEIVQLLPVLITKDDGTTEEDIWQAAIQFVDDYDEDDDDDEETGSDPSD